jgi:hypothetical protein
MPRPPPNQINTAKPVTETHDCSVKQLKAIWGARPAVADAQMARFRDAGRAWDWR